MLRVQIALPLALAGLLASAGAARAEGDLLILQKVVYLDEKEAPLGTPEGVACSPDGRLVVGDATAGRLLTYKLQGGAVTGGSDVRLPQLTVPSRLQLDAEGNVLALDRKTRRIVKVGKDGTFKGTLELPAVAGAPAVPESFRIDAGGTLYVIDLASSSVLVVSPAGKLERSLAIPKGKVLTDLTVDSTGTVFAIDPVGATVWSAPRNANALQQVGASFKDRASFPTSIESTGKGRLLVVDQNGHGLITIGQDGSFLGRQLGMGWSDGMLYYPAQICLAQNTVVVADRGNSRVQIFTSGQ